MLPPRRMLVWALFLIQSESAGWVHCYYYQVVQKQCTSHHSYWTDVYAAAHPPPCQFLHALLFAHRHLAHWAALLVYFVCLSYRYCSITTLNLYY